MTILALCRENVVFCLSDGEDPLHGKLCVNFFKWTFENRTCTKGHVRRI